MNRTDSSNCTTAYLANNSRVKELKVPNIAQRAWINSASRYAAKVVGSSAKPAASQL